MRGNFLFAPCKNDLKYGKKKRYLQYNETELQWYTIKEIEYNYDRVLSIFAKKETNL